MSLIEIGPDQVDLPARGGAPLRLTASELKALARDCGADDCGLVAVDDPHIAVDRPYVTKALPGARALLSIIGRMHREPVRSPARSVSNHEFHQSGHEVDEVARKIVRRLEDMGVPALNPAMAFPMELDNFPERGWIVSHKLVAEAAGLGKMGIHRSLIHPVHGSFVLLGTVIVGVEVEGLDDRQLDFNPCLGCKLCVAACPVGALKPDGYFDFSACLTHNYHQFMGGFSNWIDTIADAGSAQEYRDKVSYPETVSRWQSLAFGPSYNAAYCIAVCPAGENVIGPYLADKKGHRDTIVRPLQQRTEPVYVTRGTDAADHVAKRFPHKRLRVVRPGVRATTIAVFLSGIRLSFQPGRAGDLNAVYHFRFTGAEPAEATVTIRDGRLAVETGLSGKPDIVVTADSKTWLSFLAKETSLLRALLTRRLRFRGSPKLLAAFGRCFPS